jgi:DNA-binding CsgD family transcriptional regulator
MHPKSEIAKVLAKPDLTPRQRQILKLLHAGMVNKEVARELDIGLGTVKQHIVALFKKLKVSNRAMAVAQGRELLENEGGAMSANMLTATAGLLESRPCVVLSIALPEDASHTAVRMLYGILADVSAMNDAVFLARKGNAAEVIFGIQRVTEYDVAVALQTACGIYADLYEWDPQLAARLRGCITAGMAVASMKRFGGWTGEAVASAAIAFAREMLSATAAGHVAFDSVTHDLIEAFGIAGPKEAASLLSFEQLKDMHWTGTRRRYPLVGRETELTLFDVALKGALKGQGMLIHLEGEMGMGKSRLCEEFCSRCQTHGGGATFYRCLPVALGRGLYDIVSGETRHVRDVVAVLGRMPPQAPEVVIIDDFHLLDAERQLLLAVAADEAVGEGKLVVFSGRRVSAGEASAETVRLRRMSNKDVETLVKNALAKGASKGRAKKVEQISGVAAGVPLFAVELARQFDPQRVAFPVLVAINARLDSLQLDHRLLRAVATASGPLSIDELAAALGEDAAALRPQAERATQAGVLGWGADDTLAFSHPLLKRAIAGGTSEQ